MARWEYKLSLFNVWWNENSIDTQFFNDIQSQTAYFNNLSLNGLYDTTLLNFDLGNGVETTIVYRDASGRANNELLQQNYCMVIGYKDNEEQFRNYYFAYPVVDSSSQVILKLRLDVIQTYYFKYKNNILPGVVKRAHLNRWLDNGDGTVSFNGNVDSPLFERESITNVPKRLVSRTKLDYVVDTNIGDINTWLKNNIEGWVYIYLTQSTNEDIIKSYTYRGAGRQTKTLPTIYYGTKGISLSLQGVCSCLCYPIYKNSRNKILLKEQDGFNLSLLDITIDIEGYELFKKLNNNNSYVVSIKYDTIPPLPITAYTMEGTGESQDVYTIDPDGNLVFFRNGPLSPHGIQCYGNRTCLGLRFSSAEDEASANKAFGLILVQTSENIIPLNNFTIDKQFTFNKSEVVGSLKNPKYNPKLLNSDYYTLSLTNTTGDIFNYDLQKVNTNLLKPIVSSPKTPDIKRLYFRLNELTGVYIKESAENLTGLVSSDDNNLMVDNDYLSQTLAENRNFFLQQTVGIAEPAISFVSGGGLQKRDIAEAGGVLGGTIVGALNSALTIDNMRAVPNIVKNSNGNVYFNVAYSEYGEYIELYDILDSEKQAINDNMCKFGFAYNRIGFVGDFDNIRKFYNYIEIEIDTIKAPLSNIQKDLLVNRLSAVRFWNVEPTPDIWNFENYERSLENE